MARKCWLPGLVLGFCAIIWLGVATPVRANPLVPQGASLTVDTNSDSDSRDGELSLREAINLARGSAATCYTDHEKGQTSGVAWVGPLPCGSIPNIYSGWNVSAISPGVGAGYADDIGFNSSVSSIAPGSQLPDLGCDDDIDGAGGSGGKVTLNGGSAGSAEGLRLACGNTTGSQIRNLIIRNFALNGIIAYRPNGAQFQGLELFSNGQSGLKIVAESGVNARNLQIGGTVAGQRNLIYSNGQDGITIEADANNDRSGSQSIAIEGNHIGADAGGISDKGNSGNGIYLWQTFGVRIGGDVTTTRNLISGNNNDGIKIDGSAAFTNTVFNNYIGVNISGTAKLGNAASGVAILGGAHQNQVGGGPYPGRGNLIGGNSYGVFIANADSTDNRVHGNNIGTTVLASSNLGNTNAGIAIFSGAQSNKIGAYPLGYRNVIGYNGQGIDIGGSNTAHNMVRGNYIGSSGYISMPNGIGIRMTGGTYSNAIGTADYTSVFANLISANSTHGIGIYNTGTTSNTIVGNYIGLNSDAFALPNGENGIVVQEGAAANTINDNKISGNNQHGVLIQHAGTDRNAVTYNDIGMHAGNGWAGVAIYNGAKYTLVNTNTIVNNAQGVDISSSGTAYNRIQGNDIGIDVPLGTAYPYPNGIGVRLTGGAQYNIIGGSSASEGNRIAANTSHGIGLYNTGTSSNTIGFNNIGYFTSIGNGQHGVVVQEAAASNVITANVISGNGGHGILINGAGTDRTRVLRNKIGLPYDDSLGNGNGGDGIRIENGAQFAQIGDYAAGNTISGNGNDGVGINGAHNNSLRSNLIGLKPSGTVTAPNTYSGVAIIGGASGNTIGGTPLFILPASNYIAGNGSNGVYIYGANSNYVLANFIGYGAFGNGQTGVVVYNAAGNVIGDDGLGNTIIRSGGPGIDLSNTSYTSVQGNNIGTDGSAAYSNTIGIRLRDGANNNLIGGPAAAEKNVISGNSQQGVLLTGSGTATNTVQGNLIGLNAAGSGAIPNGGSGIEFAGLASGNIVQSGYVAYNKSSGVVVRSGSNRNRLAVFSIYANGGLGIDLEGPSGPGCTAGASGGNHCLAAPVITSMTITGAAGTAPAGSDVYLYLAETDPSGYGEGKTYLTSTTANGAGQWSFNFGANVCIAYGSDFKLTATATANTETSEFSATIPACNKNYLPIIRR